MRLNKRKLIAEHEKQMIHFVQSWIKTILNLNVKCEVSGANYLNHMQFQVVVITSCPHQSRDANSRRKREFKSFINDQFMSAIADLNRCSVLVVIIAYWTKTLIRFCEKKRKQLLNESSHRNAISTEHGSNKVADNQLSNMLLLILSQEFLFPYQALRQTIMENYSLFRRLMTDYGFTTLSKY